MSLAERVRAGITWGTIARATQLASQLLAAAVLARLLSPADFGVVNMSAIFLNIANALADFGIRAYVVQKKEVFEDERRAALALGWLLGAVIFLAALVVAAPLSHFYREPRLTLVLAVQAVVYVIANAASIHVGMLTRGLRFRRLAAAEIMGSSVYLAVACGLAWFGSGYWSLVIGRIFSAASTLIVVVPSLHDIVPRWAPLRNMRSLLRFGGTLTVTGILGQIDENFDNIVVGRVFGTSPLGLYAVSYNTAALPQKHVAFMVAAVANPVLARAEAGLPFAAACARYVRYQALGPAAMAVAIGVLAPEVCTILLGRRWPDAPALVAIMSFSTASLSIATAVGGTLVSRGLVGDVLRFQILKLGTTVASVLVGTHWGLPGVAVGFALGSACSLMTGLAWTGARTGLGASTLVRAAAGPVAAVVVAGAVAWYARSALRTFGVVGPAEILCLGVLAFAGTLALTFMVVSPQGRSEVLSDLHSFFRGSQEDGQQA